MTREYLRLPENQMTDAQHQALGALCMRYNVEYDPDHYLPAFDLPEGYVCGWVGGPTIQEQHPTIFVGCGPDGDLHS